MNTIGKRRISTICISIIMNVFKKNDTSLTANVHAHSNNKQQWNETEKK